MLYLNNLFHIKISNKVKKILIKSNEKHIQRLKNSYNKEMELTEYLKKSKEQRKETIRAADNYYSKTISLNFGRDEEKNSLDMFLGPSPQRLKLFESKVNKQLRKIFSPGLYEDDQSRVKHITHIDISERISKTYSKNSQIIKKKQRVILPRFHYFNPIKIPVLNILSKHSIGSLEGQSKIQEVFYQKMTPPKRVNKEDILLPILSTVGTHEQRSKIYKYR